MKRWTSKSRKITWLLDSATGLKSLHDIPASAWIFVRLRHSRTALWCCASSHQATGVLASRPCRAPIADACGRAGLRAALACFTPAGVVGLACCSLHPCTPFSPSRSARPVGAGGRSAVFEPVTAALRVAASALLVRDVAGQYRPAEADEVLLAAQQLLAAQVRGSDLMDSPAVVKDFLRARLGHLPHEVFAVVHLDAQNRVLDYVEMFRGTVSQTSVYPREVVRDALLRNSSALVLVHNHPSGAARPSRADEYLTQTLKQAAALVDVRVLDHFIVAGDSVNSMAEQGLV